MMYPSKGPPQNNRSPQPSFTHFFKMSIRRSYGFLSIFIIIGFMVVIGINFIRSLSNQYSHQDVIINRQVKLLNRLKNETEERHIQAILTEYDSLSTLLDELEAQNNKTQSQ